MANAIGDIVLRLYRKFREVFTYVVVGFCTTALSFLAYAFFSRVFSLHYMVSNALAFVIAIIFSFLMNKFVVFKTREKSILPEFLLFVSARLFSLAIDFGIMYAGVDMLHIHDMLVKLADAAIITCVNYIVSKLVIFRRKP